LSSVQLNVQDELFYPSSIEISKQLLIGSVIQLRRTPKVLWKKGRISSNRLLSLAKCRIYKTMPLVFSYKGYRFFFYSNEGNPLEPLHIHVRKNEKLAKIWLEPAVSVAKSHGFSPKELNWILKIVYNRREEIRSGWNDFFKV